MAETGRRTKELWAQRLSLAVWRFNEKTRALYEGLEFEMLWSFMEKEL